MNELIKKITEKDMQTRSFPLKVGQKVRIAQRIQEGNKERIQNFDGVIIAISGSDRTIDGTFTVRAMIESVGVEKIFPFYCKTIDSIKVLGESKTRRSKIYYLRDRSGKSARLRYKDVEMLLTDEEPVSVEEEKNEEQSTAEDINEPKVEETTSVAEEKVETKEEVKDTEEKTTEEEKKEE